MKRSSVLAVALMLAACGKSDKDPATGQPKPAPGPTVTATPDAAVPPGTDAAVGCAAGEYQNPDPVFCIHLPSDLKPHPVTNGKGWKLWPFEVPGVHETGLLVQSHDDLGQYDKHAAELVTAATELDEAEGEKIEGAIIEQGALAGGAGAYVYSSETQTAPTKSLSLRWKAVIKQAKHVYLCEVYWRPKDPGAPMIDERGDDRTAQIDACKSLHEP